MSDQKSCILVVGSTGTGKSTLVGFCTGVHVETSDNTGECTKEIQAVKDQDGLTWVDTVGFDGTDTNRSDEEAFQKILRFLQAKNISYVKAVIWSVNPEIREAARLQEQARLINMFKEEAVWNNVVIVVKSTRGNVERDGAGALAACKNENVKAIGYTLIEQLKDREKMFWEKQSLEDRVDMGILTQMEAKTLIQNSIKALPPSLQVVFCNSKCEDCGVISDPRLFPLSCHTREEYVHPKEAVPIHTGPASMIHPSEVARRHTEPRTGLFMTCCINTHSHPGCQLYYPCCQQIHGVDFGPPEYLAEVDIQAALAGIFGGDSDKHQLAESRKRQQAEKLACTIGTNILSWLDTNTLSVSFAEISLRLPAGVKGCKNIFTCCGAEVSERNTGCARSFPCCGGKEGSPGCWKQCSHCKSGWGQFDIDKGCIGTKHKNIVSWN